MTQTISNTITTGVTLSLSSQNPLIVTDTGAILPASNNNGVYGLSGQAWTVSNSGRIISRQDAVYLNDGGYVANAGTMAGQVAIAINRAAGTVSNSGTAIGSIEGVALSLGGTVTNTGTITALYGVDISGGSGTVTNQGQIFGYNFGVLLRNGGAVTNSSNGFISAHGYRTGASYYDAVRLNAGGTVVNAGTVEGSHIGVVLAGGGTVINSGTIAGTRAVGVGIYVDLTGTVINSDTISGVLYAVQFKTTGAARLVETTNATLLGKVKGGSGINTLELAAGSLGKIGTIANFASFSSFQTIVVDSGADWLLAGASGFTGNLNNAGTLSNGVTLAAAEVINTGSVITSAGSSTTRNALYDTAAGASILNLGTIATATVLTNGLDVGVLLEDGGTVANAGATSRITGVDAIRVNGATGSVGNAGTLFGYFDGADLLAGGTLTNTGTIIGQSDVGVAVDGTTGIVFNAGTISSASVAVYLLATTGRLVETADATLFGLAKGTGLSDTLELAAGTSGRVGTIASLAQAYFTGFETVAVDTGTDWQLEGATGFTGTVNNAGTVSAGLSVAASRISNTGSILSAVYDSAAGASVTNQGSILGDLYAIRLSAGGSVTNSGLLTASSQAIRVAGAGGSVGNSGTIVGGLYGVVLAAGGLVTNTGTILGTTQAGIAVSGASATVVNSGSIGGAKAIRFAATQSARLVETADATLLGLVAATGPSNTLELASSTAGRVGTIANFAASFTGFQTIDIDAGATWDLAGIGSFTGTLINAGSLFAATTDASVITNDTGAVAFGLYDGATASLVTNFGTVAGTVTLGGGSLINSGTISGGVTLSGTTGTLFNSGTIAGSPIAIDFATTQHGRLVETPNAVQLGTIEASGPSNTLELAAGSAGQIGTIAGTLMDFQTIDVDAGATWRITNVAGFAGTLINAGTLPIGISVAAALIVNTGTVPSAVGIYDSGAAVTVVNQGQIAGGSEGILLSAGGIVSNSGVVLDSAFPGSVAIEVVDGAGSVGNSGTVTGSYDGLLVSSGTVTNSGTITGTSNVGIYLGGSSGTVYNSGSVSGSVAAIQFATTQYARLVETADAALSGVVTGGTLSNTLELAASTAGQIGTITSVATAFTGFQTLDIDAGASWLVDTLGSFATGGTIDFLGTGATIAFGDTLVAPATIFGFAQGETIDFANLGFVAGDTATLLAGNTLEIDFPAGGSFYLDLDPSEDFTGKFFHLAAAGNTTMLTTDNMPCYCRGTHIRVPDGETRVEDLRIGDLVLTASGAARPIKWIGTRCYDGRFAENNPAVLPIRFAAGALGPDLPCRELQVSPEHALFLDGALVAARLLCNGGAIAQLHGVARIDYFHIELDSHDILLAEGVPAESFLDRDSRAMFHNAHEFAALYPQDVGGSGRFCAERLEADSPALEALRRRLAAPADRGTLRGRVDECDRIGVRGWAADGASRVILRVLRDGIPVARAAAALPRIDLAQANLGDCAFDIGFSPALDPTCSHLIRVLRDEDGAELDGSPFRIDAASAFDAATQARLVRHVADAAHDPALRDGMITWLVAQTEGLLQARAQHQGRAPSLRPRWGAHLPEGPAQPDPVPARPQALVLDDRLPRHGASAGAEAVLDHMRALIRLGFDVSFCPVQDAAQTDMDALEATGIAVLGGPWYASVEEVLRRHAGHFAVIYLHRAANAAAYGRLARHYCPRAQLVYAVADLHHVRLARQARMENRPELHDLARRLAAEETLAAWRADAVITHSQDEAERLRRAVPGVAVHVVPWSIAPRAAPSAFAARAGFAFVGSFAHEPNIDAVHYLAEAVLPLLRRRLPQAECLLVGGPVPPSVQRLAQPGLRVLGHVDDLDSVFAKLRLTVAPLRFGAGLKGKVLESFAAGLPCIGTPIAFEGMDLPATLEACRAEGPAALAEAIVLMHEDETANAAVSAAAQHFAATRFSAERVEALLRPVVEPALRRIG